MNGDDVPRHETSRPVVVPPPTRRYWIGQTALALVFPLMTLLEWRFGVDPAHFVLWRALVSDAMLVFLVIGITHRLRPVVLADVADLRGLPRRLPRRVAALVAIGLAASAVELLLPETMATTPAQDVPSMVSDAALGSLNWGFSLTLWCVVYGAAQLVIVGNRSTSEQLRLVAAAREAEARALRAQMDPHFLFNAINSARALVTVDPDGARDLLTRYAEVLRYITTHSRGTTETLAEALPVAIAYLEIERRRFPDRLQVAIDVPEAVRHAQIPPLLLQTLVENAVRHGIACSPAGGTVRIRARAEDRVLTLTVSNPAPHGAAADGGTGVGLENSRERLRLLHGDAARLDFSHGTDGEVWVSVQLPLPATSSGAAS